MSLSTVAECDAAGCSYRRSACTLCWISYKPNTTLSVQIFNKYAVSGANTSVECDIDEDEICPLAMIEDLRHLERLLRGNVVFRQSIVLFVFILIVLSIVRIWHSKWPFDHCFWTYVSFRKEKLWIKSLTRIVNDGHHKQAGDFFDKALFRPSSA